MASYGVVIPCSTLDVNDAVYIVLLSYGSYFEDSLVVVFRGSLEVHLLIKGEHEALTYDFDHYETSLMDEDHFSYSQR